MSDLPPPPDLYRAETSQNSEVATIGVPETAPCKKEQDDMAQLSHAFGDALPVTDEPEYAHPMLADVEPDVPSEEDFPIKPVVPVPTGRRPMDGKVLDPYNTMGLENTWPGVNGLPFRGQKIDLKSDDERQPNIVYQANVEILELSNTDDMKRYCDIMQAIANGMAKLGAEDRVYDPEMKNWRIFIRWWELHVALKK